jgi:hypothetical protein
MATSILNARPALSRAVQPHHLAVAGLALLALWLQLSAFPNHDVAWVLWGTERLIEGAAWGRDIIEPNPPLAWYLSVPSTWLAMKLGLPVAASFQVAVTAVAMISIFVFEALLRKEGQASARASVLPTLVIAVFLLILPYRDFGQREHLMLIAILPYLALVALRCRGDTIHPASACAIGLAAGLGLGLKPYFLGVPLLVEASAMLIARRWFFAFRIETVAIGGIILAYAVLLLLIDRSYVDLVVPLAQGIYWSFNVPWAAVVTPILLPLAATAAAIVLTRQTAGPFPLIAAAAVAGFALACIVQHKGYSYHQFPVVAGAALAVAAAAVSARPVHRRLAHAVLVVFLLVGAARTAFWWQENGAGGARTIETHAVIDAIDRYASGGRFLVVAVHPYPAFPAALYADAAWSSRTNSQWFLPAVARLRDRGSDPAALAFAESHARAFVLHDLSQNPEMVIIDTDARRHTGGPRDSDFLAFYLEDPRFARLWAAYREVQPIGSYRLFVRGGRR